MRSKPWKKAPLNVGFSGKLDLKIANLILNRSKATEKLNF